MRSNLFAAGIVSLGLSLVIAHPTAAFAETDDVAELRALVGDLQRQVDELKAERDDTWLTERRAEEIRGLVADVLADADLRASLLQTGATAGRDGGFFFIASTDGKYLLRIAGQSQVRFVYNNQQSSPTDDHRSGFEMRRVKFDFRGHVFDPTWTYYVEAEANRNGGAFALAENGWLMKDLENGWKIRFGQFKPLYLREESISSRRLQGVERSQVNAEFTAGTAQGVEIRHEAERWRAFASFIDGIETRNTGWQMEDTEYAFTARAEFLLDGDWKSIDDDVAFNDVEPALMVGAAAMYQRDEFGTGSNLPFPDFNNSEVENLGLTADVTWKQNGVSLAGAVVYRNLENESGSLDLDQLAVVLRGGLFLRDDVELYGQYEWGDFDLAGIDDLSTITLGVTKYWDKHNLKWQSDIGYGLNEVALPWANDSAGWRADAPGEDGQIVLRSQFQLLF